jgi:ABC-2 type transport system permease protein
LKAYLNLTRAGLLAFSRDRQGMFWSFFFPLFFIVIFGTIFGRADNGPNMKIDVGIVAPEKLPDHIAWMPDVFRKKAPALHTHDGTLEQETQALREGKVRAVLIFPSDMAEKHIRHEKIDVKVLFDPSQQQIAPIVRNIIDQTFSYINQGMTQSPTLVAATHEPITMSGKKEKPKRGFDYTMPGILAMTVMQLGLFTAITFIAMREKGTLKRLRATPLPRSTVISAQVTQRLIIGVIQTLTLIVVGTAFFQFHMSGSWFALLGLIIFGVLTFICIGAVLSAIAKTQESGISLVQLVNFPMMFLSGMFLPLELLPDGLQKAVAFLPSTHLANLMRSIMVNEPSRYGVGVSLGVMGAWMLGGLLIASRTFRWE